MGSDRVTALATHEVQVLDDACGLLRRAFGHPPYLVGSAGIGGSTEYRDVDVRMILNDEEFDALFSRDAESEGNRDRWELLSMSVGAYLRERTGLLIDFQFQRQTEANAGHDKPRNPLGMGRIFASGGDATPWNGRLDQNRCDVPNPASLADVDGTRRCIYPPAHGGPHSFDVPIRSTGEESKGEEGK